jgi:hypothetical protein
MRVDLYTDM